MQKKLFCSLIIVFNLQFVISQNNNETSLFNWFDKEIGANNLDLNNGLLHQNIYPTLNNATRYFENEKYVIGEVEYDNQYYGKVTINYDLFTDELLVKPYGENTTNALIVLKEKNKSFVLKGRKFVNLNYNKTQTNEDANGYFEEILSTDFLQFYTKHKKTIRDVYVGNQILYDYTLKTTYYILYKNNFYTINSKKSIVKIFPEFKSQINSFFQEYNKLERYDKALFMKNIMNYINGLQ